MTSNHTSNVDESVRLMSNDDRNCSRTAQCSLQKKNEWASQPNHLSNQEGNFAKVARLGKEFTTEMTCSVFFNPASV